MPETEVEAPPVDVEPEDKRTKEWKQWKARRVAAGDVEAEPAKREPASPPMSQEAFVDAVFVRIATANLDMLRGFSGNPTGLMNLVAKAYRLYLRTRLADLATAGKADDEE